jgi:hypothetical protein
MRDLLYYAQLFFEAAVGVVGIRNYEEPRYAVLATLPNGVEIRRYAPRLAAQVELPGSGLQSREEAFRTLFRYIAGANVATEKIAMTVPVATRDAGEKVAMTAPVATAASDGAVRMQFFLPAAISAETAPRPTDARVRIIPVPEQTTAVLRFSGRGLEADLLERKAELLAGLAASGWRATAQPEVLFYDAPFTLPFLRRNEAAVSVEPL